MKTISLVIFLCIGYFGFNQKLSIDEIVINANYSDANYLTKFTPRFGFGFGIHHRFRKEKKTNLILGIEYNTVNYKNANFFSPNHFEKKQNVNVNLHSIDFPLFLRINLNKIFFLKAGININFIFLHKEKGLMIYYSTLKENKMFKSNYISFFPYPGGTIGSGVNYSLLNQQLFTSFSYSFYYNNQNYFRPVSTYNLSLGIKF